MRNLRAVIRALSHYGVIASVRRKIGSRDRNLRANRSRAIEFCAATRIGKCSNFVASRFARTLDRLVRSLACRRKGELDLTGRLIGSFARSHADEKGNLISSTPISSSWRIAIILKNSVTDERDLTCEKTCRKASRALVNWHYRLQCESGFKRPCLAFCVVLSCFAFSFSPFFFRTRASGHRTDPA